MKQLKLAFLAIGIFAMDASADTISFTATSNGSGFTMHVTGVDSSGDNIDATFGNADIVSVPFCPCLPGSTIQVIDGWNGGGTATVNGVNYSANISTIGGNEGGGTFINGVLPPFTGLDGSESLVTLPINWSMDIFFYTQEPNGIIDTLFELKGSGVGTASADLLNMQGLYWGDHFSYASAPEPSTGMMLGMGLIAGIVVRRKAHR
jgi:hypothetical protein